MTTINTAQGLTRLLREQPDWAEELRAGAQGNHPDQIAPGRPATVRPTAVAVDFLAETVPEMNNRMTHVDEDAATFKAGTDFLREIHYRRAVEAKAVYHAFWDLGFVDARPMDGDHQRRPVHAAIGTGPGKGQRSPRGPDPPRNHRAE